MVMSFWLFAPNIINAAGLVPCGGSNEPACSTELFVGFVNNMIGWLISMLGVIAVIALVYTGFRLLTSAGNESEWSKAKEMFTNIVIGVIIILAAWLIIDTVLRGLTGSGLDGWTNDFGEVQEVQNATSTNQVPLYCYREQGGQQEEGCVTEERCQESVQRLRSQGRLVTQCYPANN